MNGGAVGGHEAVFCRSLSLKYALATFYIWKKKYAHLA
jgi:hypothetical protein